MRIALSLMLEMAEPLFLFSILYFFMASTIAKSLPFPSGMDVGSSPFMEVGRHDESSLP